MSEILQSVDFTKQSKEIQDNLTKLLEIMNKIRKSYGKPMKVTSGLRSMEDHLRIYREKAKKEGIPFDESKVPKKSKHLFGQACDIYDPNKELQKWCTDNEQFLKDIGVWLEAFESTPNWVHYQIVPYNSWSKGSSIWFKP
jgi:uncharacterized protein YcbK (DUF882 family)